MIQPGSFLSQRRDFIFPDMDLMLFFFFFPRTHKLTCCLLKEQKPQTTSGQNMLFAGNDFTSEVSWVDIKIENVVSQENKLSDNVMGLKKENYMNISTMFAVNSGLKTFVIL